MPTVDLGFPVAATRVPRDHGYALYSAISRVAPALHEAAWLGIHPLSGATVDGNMLVLGERAELRLRVPSERIGDVIGLAGATLELVGAPLKLGPPTVHALAPASSVDARIVVIKLTAAPHRNNEHLNRSALDVQAFAERYQSELTRQLAKIGIEKLAQIRGRQSMTVGANRIVGYSVRVDGLTADQSLVLQREGLGGKRRMGCGVFRPTRGA